MKWLTSSQVAQAPPWIPKKVVEEPTNIPITTKTLKQALGVDSDDMTCQKKQVKRIVLIAPYYREAVTG